MKRLILAAALLSSATAHAEFWDGNKLWANLNEAPGYSNGAALGFIVGVHDLGEGVLHCSPASITAGQARDVVFSYMQEFPSLRHNAAQGIVTRALQRAWPCPKKGNPT